MRELSLAIAFALLFLPHVVQAHVRILPAESKLGASESYTFHVPTEGAVATSSVELEIPSDISVSSVSDAGELQRANGRVVSIAWKVEIPPGQSHEFTFKAMNPNSGQEIVWKAHQHFADGSSRYWSEPAGSREPAPTTKLTK